jgi:hypothetical protein
MPWILAESLGVKTGEASRKGAKPQRKQEDLGAREIRESTRKKEIERRNTKSEDQGESCSTLSRLFACFAGNSSLRLCAFA